MSSHHRHQDTDTRIGGLGVVFYLVLYAGMLFGLGMILKGIGL